MTYKTRRGPRGATLHGGFCPSPKSLGSPEKPKGKLCSAALTGCPQCHRPRDSSLRRNPQVRLLPRSARKPDKVSARTRLRGTEASRGFHLECFKLHSAAFCLPFPAAFCLGFFSNEHRKHIFFSVSALTICITTSGNVKAISAKGF